MSSSIARPAWRTLLLALVLALCPALAQAQSGIVRGTVAGKDGEALAGARVHITGARIGATTNPLGAFMLRGVPVGEHTVTVSHVGYQTATRPVTVTAGEETLVAFQLEDKPFELDALVISASRQSERVTEAPATVTRIGSDVLDNAVGNTFAGALKEVKGLDFVQVGMTSVGINARGFNSSFNNRMLMVEDGRVMVLPENGLPVGQFTATPKVDLAGMEVLVGPGAALYGADASSGVLSLETRDPRAYPGMTVEVTGGNRAYRDVQARYAAVLGNFGFKLAGEMQSADDWSNRLTLLPGSRSKLYRPGDEKVAGWQPERGPGGQEGLDWDASVMRGSGALVWYRGASRLELAGGASTTDGVGQTNVGRNQLDDWQYNFLQTRFSSSHWYFNAYRAQSKSGHSYANNRFTNNYFADLARPADQRRDDDALIQASDWPSDGRMYAAELQYHSRVPLLLNTAVVLGGQYRSDVVSSDRQWLTDRLTGEDISIRQVGLYGQATTPVMPWLDVVLAGRLDDHENYERQFSPKAGIVFKPVQGQNFRVTYNRAFKSPTILQTNFHIPDWTGTIAIFGNTEGFTIQKADGSEHKRYAALEPEENTTWEFGYKGVLGDRLFVDVAHYRSEYQNFMSPLAIISDPFGLNLAGQGAGVQVFAYDAAGERILNHNGIAPIVLTYYNLGRADVSGIDAGVNYVVSPRVSLRGTLSTIQLDDAEVEAGREESTSLNSPELKWTLGGSFQDFGGFTAGLTMRHVDEYYFRSGINMGRIPAFTTLDASVAYRLEPYNTQIQLGVSNLFSCVGQFTYNVGVDTRFENPLFEERKCEFGAKHQEMINMPSIGTMVFLGVKYQTR
ncbi:MAG TPA: TonB-dependent receptor [Longimicrobium sp.]|nr:TonB-dependent receptor [Longimicrobium sp.]